MGPPEKFIEVFDSDDESQAQAISTSRPSTANAPGPNQEDTDESDGENELERVSTDDESDEFAGAGEDQFFALQDFTYDDTSDNPVDASLITEYMPQGHIRIRRQDSIETEEGQYEDVDIVETVNDSILTAAHSSIVSAMERGEEWTPESITGELLSQEPFCYLDERKVRKRVLKLWKQLRKRLSERNAHARKTGQGSPTRSKPRRLKRENMWQRWVDRFEGLTMMIDGMTPAKPAKKSDVEDKKGKTGKGHVAKNFRGRRVAEATSYHLPSRDLPSPDLPSRDLPSPDLPSPDLPSRDLPSRFVLFSRHLPSPLPSGGRGVGAASSRDLPSRDLPSPLPSGGRGVGAASSRDLPSAGRGKGRGVGLATSQDLPSGGRVRGRGRGFGTSGPVTSCNLPNGSTHGAGVREDTNQDLASGSQDAQPDCSGALRRTVGSAWKRQTNGKDQMEDTVSKGSEALKLANKLRQRATYGKKKPASSSSSDDDLPKKKRTKSKKKNVDSDESGLDEGGYSMSELKQAMRESQLLARRDVELRERMFRAQQEANGSSAGSSPGGGGAAAAGTSSGGGGANPTPSDSAAETERRLARVESMMEQVLQLLQKKDNEKK